MYDAVRARRTFTKLLPTFGFDTVFFENDVEYVVSETTSVQKF